MATYRRTVLRQLSLANNAYVNAEITIYDADLTSGQRTSTLSTVYDAAVGGNVVSNPYKLDSKGKAPTPLYIDKPVVIVFDTEELGTHTSGVIFPQSGILRSDYEEGEVYLPGDIILDGAAGDNTGNLYASTATFTSTSWAFDKANNLQLIVDVAEVEAFANASEASSVSAAASAVTAASEASDAANSATSASDTLVLVQALAGSVPTPVSINYLRQNAGATGFEYRTPAQVRSDISAAELVNNYLIATSDPTVNNDGVDTAGLGTTFQVRSLWLNTSSNEFFICLNNSTGAANWQTTTLTLDDLGSMATQNASSVAITGGSITDVNDTITITATGAISSGEFVALTQSGQYSAVANTAYSFLEDGSPQTIGFPVNGASQGVFHYGQERLVITDSSNNAYVGAVSAGAVSFGASNTISASWVSGNNNGIVEVPDSNQVVFVYPNSTTLYGRVGVINTGSNTLTMGVEDSEVIAQAVDTKLSLVWDSANNQAVAIWQESAGGDDLHACAASISGTALTFNPDEEVCSLIGSTDYFFGGVYDAIENKFAAFIGRTSTTATFGGSISCHDIVVALFENDGTNFTSAPELLSLPINQLSHFIDVTSVAKVDLAINPNTGEIIIVGIDSVNGEILVIGCTIRNGVGVSGIAGIVEGNASNISQVHVRFEPDANTFAFNCYDAGNDDVGWGQINSEDGVPKICYYNGLIENNNDQSNILPAGNGRFAQFGSGGTSGNQVWVHQTKWDDTTADRWVGIAQENIANTATGKLMLRGGLDENQSGLTAGTKYYLAADGSLSAQDTGRFVGYAVSSTNILTT